MEGLENAEDIGQAWWTDNKAEEEFRISFSGYITLCFTTTKNGYQQQYEKPAVDLGFWEPRLDTEYDSEEI